MESFAVELTQGAARDLEQIYDYLAENRRSEDAAALLDSFLERVETLEYFPMRGVVPRELEALGLTEFRQILLPPYRLIYRVTGQVVHVLLVADGRRDMQSLLQRRLLGG